MAPFPYSPEDGSKYTLVAPDGSRAVWNDDYDVDTCDLNSSATGLDSPDVTTSSSLLVGADGGQNGLYFYGMRPITLNGTVYNFTTPQARATKVAKLLQASNCMQGDGSLSFIPSWRVANLISNPSAEYGVGGWSTQGSATVTQLNTALVAPGSKSFQVSGNTSNSAGIFQNIANIESNVPYNFALPVQVASGVSATAYIAVQIHWFDKSGNMLRTDYPGGTPGSTALQTLIGTFTSPVGAFSAQILIFLFEPTSANFKVSTWTVDNILFSRQTTVYTDGDQPGNWWHGVKGLSQSGNYVPMYTPVRRQQPVRINGNFAKTFQIPLVSQYSPLFSYNAVYSNYSLTAATATGTAAPAGSSVSVENYGNYPAYPLLYVYGATSASFTVNNTTDGTYVEIDSPSGVPAGKSLTIDVLNHTATLSDGTSWNQYINFTNSTWPRVSANKASLWSVSSGSLIVQFRHSWV